MKEQGEKSNTKTYRVIIDYLRQGIEGGRFKRGQKLPSEKELCEHFSTSRSSVREALSALEYVGLIEVRGGSGYYVSGSSPVTPGESIEQCATKMVLILEDDWNIRTMQALFEMGLDGASLAIKVDEGAQWSRKVRAVRQAANDTGMFPTLIAEISEATAEKRILAAEMAIKAGMDCVIVDTDSDMSALIEVRRTLDSVEANIMVLARMTTAVGSMADALQIADGLIVEASLFADGERSFVISGLAAKATQSGKFIFVAGSVQETMAVSGVEGQDLVQKAVQKGFDGVLITTAGAAQKFPLDVLNAVKAAARLQEEKTLTSRSDKRVGHVVASPVADALCSTAVHASQAMKSMAFVVPTETGFTPRMLAKFRQTLPVLAVSPNPHVVRQLRLAWGVRPLLSRRTLRQEDMMQLAIDTAIKGNHLRDGDSVVGVLGNMDIPNGYNSVKLITVGDIILKGQGIGNGIVSGRVAIVKSLFDINKRARNKIVAIAATDTEHIGLIEEAAGLIVEEGGLSSHAAIACMTLGKPIIVGATDATELLLEDEQITLDVMRGLVYRGWVNLG
ncbi:MAG: pyruvate kinase alpha/beta domain-containing protein [Negativicutes bacterium]